eukprot:TRINITY_DN24549_c0_g1_i1.p1 TRINITY_DN24549_c0_g1~~TRINITY_DN24549_c0_g1_i1.p1  ORF type:complete len:407 (+),score=127.34 TRINITY_DN24549_c0_g1_i1:30-1250(+)
MDVSLCGSQTAVPPAQRRKHRARQSGDRALRSFGALVDNAFPGAHAKLVQPFQKPHVKTIPLERGGGSRAGEEHWDGVKSKIANFRPLPNRFSKSEVIAEGVVTTMKEEMWRGRRRPRLRPMNTGSQRGAESDAGGEHCFLDRIDYSFREIASLEQLLGVAPRTPPKGKARTAYNHLFSQLAAAVESQQQSKQQKSHTWRLDASIPSGAPPAFSSPALPSLGRSVIGANGVLAASTTIPLGQMRASAVLLVGNRLHDLRPLPDVFGKLLCGGFLGITTLDLSQNEIATIPDELLELRCLRILNLAANRIATPDDVWKLAVLPDLFNLSTNGNPVDSTRDFRMRVIKRFPTLRILNSTPISKVDRSKLGVLKGCMLPALSFQRDPVPFSTSQSEGKSPLKHTARVDA